MITVRKGVQEMAQIMVSFRLDEKTKKEMESACRGMGLSMSAAFKIFAAKVARERRIPFELADDPFYSEENMAELLRRIEEIETGRSTLKPHDLIEVTE